ncbi:PilZ domain-containing protein [Psychrobium sp. 1_MG-2023]|uniref:PilZ domain-containing protein n=1 Tax=Psychrobium sp. 1_MG-2023 TaxID=3062624 RepID=UPI000C32A9BC|nr:PilZ domain-containing protein [Psychrobium sp. 1_MG-2023]MDP2560288.1 PilZ domain-containing protein [Psychrobium sp. 1_MG-2023]PKF55405.1 PilZ domain-containing protein [Alteromonadales bacterium alter-6D02]
MSDEQHFFSINHPFDVSAVPLAPHAKVPTQEEFEADMPAPFKLASQINQLESAAVKPLRQLSETSHDLVDFLRLQSQKIDLMMSYVLTMADGDDNKHLGHSFGGSKLSYNAPEALEIGCLVQLKIFIKENNCAIFCLGRVSACDKQSNSYLIETEFALIRNDDQEQLVRTSLNIQSNQLKQRAAKRKKQTDS